MSTNPFDDAGDSDDLLGGGYEYKCQACDAYGPVNDICLCEECGDQVERDMIRNRDWDYSASAFGLDDKMRERLRERIVGEFGEALELLAPDPGDKGKRSSRKRKK